MHDLHVIRNPLTVIPAKAGIQKYADCQPSKFRYENRYKVSLLMKCFKVKTTFSNFADPDRYVTVDVLVDDDKFMSVLPSSMLRELRVRPTRQQKFRFPDGIVRRMNIGQVRVRIDDHEATTQVIFGAEDTQPLLGRLTLGGLLLVVDPIGKRLAPMDFIPA